MVPAGTKDAVDASVVAVSVTGDRILASDASDIGPLPAHANSLAQTDP